MGLATQLLIGLLACWSVGGLLMACGFALYYIKRKGRKGANEMKAQSLPLALRLIQIGAGLGVIGSVLGFVAVWQMTKH